MFLKLKKRVEIFFYKFFKIALKTLLKREGDVLPAHLLHKIDKNIFDDFAKDINSSGIPVIIITGTNGKTTTSNLISGVLRNSGKKVCTNSNGANMPNGIFGSIIGAYTLMLKFAADFIIMEVDEKVFPYIVSRLRPDIIVITNFYRDQLDRYGEVNLTVGKIKNAIEGLSGIPVLVLPAYEPLASFVGTGLKNKQIHYGFNESFFENDKVKTGDDSINLSDALTCPNCGNIISCGDKINRNTFLLKFNCEYCGFKSEEPEICANEYGNEGKKEMNGFLNVNSDKTFYFMAAISGDYNTANYMAAYAVLKNYGLDDNAIKLSFENFKTKFGRSYKLFLKGTEISIDLVKNPTGLTRVIEKIADEGNLLNILFAFSDRDADGRDVSWIWDVDFESYAGRFGKIVITGTRPFDMAIRLKTAGVDKSGILVEYNLKRALKKIIALCADNGNGSKRVYILSTYTELLKFKKYIM